MIDVTIYGVSATTRAVGEVQQLFVTLEKESEEVAFYLKVKQISQTKTETIHCDVEGKPMVSFICENDKVVDIQILDGGILATRGLKSWWACTKANYKKMMDIIKSDAELSEIAGANNVGAMGPITEVQVGIAAGIHCI